MCFEWNHLIQVPSQEHPLILSRLRPPLFSERESQCTCLDGMAFKWPSKTSGEAVILSKNSTNSPLISSLGSPNPKIKQLHVEDLENLLHESLLLTFNTDIEDGSIEEVAEQLMIMHEEFLQGSHALMNKRVIEIKNLGRTSSSS
ncbi:unnamed protein product [Camellia sinensis]